MKIHKTMIKQFKYALVWGSSAKHRPQRVGKDHLLQDEDIVQIIKKVGGWGCTWWTRHVACD
jgi:ribosome-interacting GTPase 1